ncbi:hypothetical protein E7T06_17420 [Deinococcus sp. Arct2-2]|uniref:hypothetical protein n=1 Tax=Deinococcus sp. Arct2-2 TaxID=2568653 RepID=UPI0010A4FDF9|nr:hypothetical protein [Deinococcus sp. Arct2-2]THF68194.1 hypothetical protein E7T06_17420 [Deinococcus sp. Arct2-2]
MTDNSNRYGNEPLGKSVEEVEQDAGNVVNSSVEGEQRHDNDETFVPAIANGNATGVPAIVGGTAGGIAAVLHTNLLTDVDGNHDSTNDGTTRENRDSSEE